MLSLIFFSVWVKKQKHILLKMSFQKLWNLAKPQIFFFKSPSRHFFLICLTRYDFRACSFPVDRLDRENSTSANAPCNARRGACCSHLILDLCPAAVGTQFPLPCAEVKILRSLWEPSIIWKLYMMPDLLYCKWKIVLAMRVLVRCYCGPYRALLWDVLLQTVAHKI